MPSTAIAPTFQGNGKITFSDRQYPDPGPGELLLKVTANAICGTDREQFYAGSEIVPGHEAAGTVHIAGSDTVTEVGTTGAVFLMDFCGSCRSCRLGHTNQCLHKRADMGFSADGGYGPFEIVHESNFFPVPTEINPVEATLLLDVMGTSRHAISRVQSVRADIETVYIAGGGPIGLGLLIMARLLLGADVPIYLSDLSQWRREYAQQLGAIPVDPSQTNQLTNLGDIDVAFDSTGKQQARRIALSLLGKRGALACVGHGETLTLDVSADLIAPERVIMGSEYFRYDEMADNLALLLRHREQLTKIITHTYPVAQIDDAFATFLGGESAKVVVVQDEA